MFKYHNYFSFTLFSFFNYRIPFGILYLPFASRYLHANFWHRFSFISLKNKFRFFLLILATLSTHVKIIL